MRDRLIRAPWWVLSIVSGVYVAVGLFVMTALFSDSSARANGLSAAIAGVLAGLVFGPLSVRQTAKIREVTGDASAREVRIAARSMWRGPLPQDREQRERTLALGRHQLVRIARVRTPQILVFGLLFLGFLVVASLGEPFFYLLAAVNAGIAFWYWWWPRRVEARLSAMESAAEK